MAAYDPKRARQARRQVRVLRRRLRQQRQAARQAKTYDPLAPLTGPREKQEMRAAERLEFGPRAGELRRAIANQDQTTADRATYFDDWRQAMRESTARVNDANRINVEQTQARIDKAHADDTARVQARDAEISAQAAKFGRAPVRSEEGAQAVAAQRSQSEQSLARLRDQSGEDTKLMELRTANTVLKKIEDQDRQAARRGQLRDEEKRMAAERGQFRTDFRRKNRESERQWSAIQKEFGLKKRGQNLEFKNTAADRKIERQKLNAQKIIARMYSSANKAKARAQVRVAKLQLEKGKIDQEQFTTITNIYKGLPERPSNFTFDYNTPGGGDGKRGPGSGPNGTLANHEKDKVEKMMRDWRGAKVPPSDRRDALRRQSQANPNYPLWLIRTAWRRYVKQYGADVREDLPAYPTPNDTR